MRNFAIILFLAFISVGLQAQTFLIDNTETKEVYLRDTSYIIGTYGKSVGVKSNVVKYTTTEYPFFVDVHAIDSIWNTKSVKHPLLFQNIKYVPQRTKYFEILKDYRLRLRQNIQMYGTVSVKIPNQKIMWKMYNYAKKNNINPDVFWNYPAVDSVVNYGKYVQIKPDSLIVK